MTAVSRLTVVPPVTAVDSSRLNTRLERGKTFTSISQVKNKWLYTANYSLVFSAWCTGKSLNFTIYTNRQIIHIVKYADDLVLLAREEKVLQDMIDKLIEIGRCYGIEINVEKTKVMRISRQQFPEKL